MERHDVRIHEEEVVRGHHQGKRRQAHEQGNRQVECEHRRDSHRPPRAEEDECGEEHRRQHGVGQPGFVILGC